MPWHLRIRRDPPEHGGGGNEHGAAAHDAVAGFSASAGSQYGPWVTSLLTYEMSTRKPSLEQRGAAVITSSGTLVTLLFALVGAITVATGYTLPNTSRYWLGAALVAFVAAAVIALWTNIPRDYGEPNITADDLTNLWTGTASEAGLDVARNQLEQVAQARSVNARKARILVGAIATEIVGVALLAVAIATILIAAPPKPAATTTQRTTTMSSQAPASITSRSTATTPEG